MAKNVAESSAEKSQADSTNLKLPEPKANAAEVRKYLFQALRDRGMELDQAVQVSKKWKMGTGEELRSYSLPMYRKIFGPEQEEVWSVYMTVQPHVIRERQANEYTQNQRIVLLIGCLIVTFGFPAFAFSGRNIGLAVMSFLAGIGGFGACIYLSVVLLEEKDPYKVAVQELRSAKPEEKTGNT